MMLGDVDTGGEGDDFARDVKVAASDDDANNIIMTTTKWVAMVSS